LEHGAQLRLKTAPPLDVSKPPCCGGLALAAGEAAAATAEKLGAHAFVLSGSDVNRAIAAAT
jgi:hypothetical protein